MSNLRFGLQMIDRELQHQRAEWGLPHDINEHGSGVLLTAAGIVVMGYEGSPDECSVPWAIELHNKHESNTQRRAMIAGALCACALDVMAFEVGAAALEHAAK